RIAADSLGSRERFHEDRGGEVAQQVRGIEAPLMPGVVAIPSVGIAMSEALLVKWHKQPGDAVAADEAVAEIETDKATMDLESPVAGRLGPHLVEPGETVAVGTVIV